MNKKWMFIYGFIIMTVLVLATTLDITLSEKTYDILNNAEEDKKAEDIINEIREREAINIVVRDMYEEYMRIISTNDLSVLSVRLEAMKKIG